METLRAFLTKHTARRWATACGKCANTSFTPAPVAHPLPTLEKSRRTACRTAPTTRTTEGTPTMELTYQCVHSGYGMAGRTPYGCCVALGFSGLGYVGLMPVVLLDNIVLDWSCQGLPAVNEVLAHYSRRGCSKTAGEEGSTQPNETLKRFHLAQHPTRTRHLPSRPPVHPTVPTALH
jgi:hypothetical protein